MLVTAHRLESRHFARRRQTRGVPARLHRAVQAFGAFSYVGR
jgi:hypothetical protein